MSVARTVFNLAFEPESTHIDKDDSGTFAAVRPTLLELANDFGTIDWVTEYPYPVLALKEIEALLAI
jgi:hypothetical protein